jgi:aromatic ring-opening dioxygenase catalytic subunit (LigB family)
VPGTLSTMPTLFIPHGGGPCFFMEWNPPNTWKKMGEFLSNLRFTLPATPAAVVVISGHWETPEFSVATNPHPPLIYDYSGFPPQTYQLTYPAPGDPAIADKIRGLLEAGGFSAQSDPARGFDHGVFIPFKLIFPEANVPIVQLSLRSGLDPGTHLAAGHALEALRNQGVLIVGSGMSYHNLRGFGDAYSQESDAFDAWLTAAATAPNPAKREELLKNWLQAPNARLAHPREEHLLPLMVAAGAAGADAGQRIFSDRVMGVTVSAYQFGG